MSISSDAKMLIMCKNWKFIYITKTKQMWIVEPPNAIKMHFDCFLFLRITSVL